MLVVLVVGVGARDADRFGRQIKVANKAKKKSMKRKSGKYSGRLEKCGAC